MKTLLVVHHYQDGPNIHVVSDIEKAIITAKDLISEEVRLLRVEDAENTKHNGQDEDALQDLDELENLLNCARTIEDIVAINQLWFEYQDYTSDGFKNAVVLMKAEIDGAYATDLEKSIS